MTQFIPPQWSSVSDWMRIVANAVNPLLQGGTGGGSGTTTNAITFNNGGAGAASGTTFDGSAAKTISYNTIGAQPAGSYLTGNQMITLSGDASGSGSTAITVTIPNDTITYAKMQNVSATDKILGRSSSGAGDVQEITCTAAGRALLDDADAAAQRATLGVTAGGNLIGVRTITATGAGTYTPTSGTNWIIIELQGAGGGGGGCVSPGGTSVAFGRGGGGGGWLRKRLTADFSGASYSVGAKGTGGAAGNNAGTAGGDTTFTTTAPSSTAYTAGGGSGGSGSAAFTVPLIGGFANGGSASGGDLNRVGGDSQNGFSLATAQVYGSRGGQSANDDGTNPVITNGTNTSAAGNSANGYGGGGSGAVATGTGVARAGGDGSDGLIIIWEYS